MQSSKVLFVGNSGSGKTTIVKTLRGNLQSPVNGDYITQIWKEFPTMGVEVHPIANADHSHIYKVWDLFVV